jgi:hypothetical protein
MTIPSQAADPPGEACPADDAAVIRLSRDEPEQFAALFRRRAPEIRRYVTRRLGADAAEDVVADRHNRRAGVRCRESRPCQQAGSRSPAR